jgi:hypothetical protein
MSVGNLKTYGGKGTDFPWQLKMLLGQQATVDLLTAIAAGTVDVEPYLIDLVNNTDPSERTPNLIRATGAGTIAPLTYDFSVSNVGAGNGTILGGTIKPGETLNFAAGALGNFYTAGSVSYDGTGTELVIIFNS